MDKKLAEDPSLAQLPRNQLLNQIIDAKTCYNFDYLNWTLQETLRFSPPIPLINFSYFLEDMTIKGINFRKGDRFSIFTNALSKDSSQWQRPTEFIPERFDPDSPLYLTADGEKRNTFAMMPFNGGARVCMGKTQAEINSRIMMIFIT